jgi:hypothetical protein
MDVLILISCGAASSAAASALKGVLATAKKLYFRKQKMSLHFSQISTFLCKLSINVVLCEHNHSINKVTTLSYAELTRIILHKTNKDWL